MIVRGVRILLSAKHRATPQSSSAGLAKVLLKKKFATHTTSNSRPDAVGTLLSVPRTQLYETAVRMTKLHELDRDGLIRLLQKLRAFKRLDLSELAARAYRDGGRELSPHHFSLLMAHANEARQWVVALRYWNEASAENKVRPITHAAYLQTLKVAGRWSEAVTHFNAMVEDKIPVDPFALHALMNTTRKAAPWTVGLQVFSSAVASGATPNSVVYLVLLRCLAQSQHPHRWHFALSILQGLDGTEERNAGMFNATMDALSSSRRWQQATALYHQMKQQSIVPSKETFRVLMDIRRTDAAHCIRVLAEAHKHGSPVTSEMYYSVFRSLLSLNNGPKHVLALAQSEARRATADAGNPNYQTAPITLALLDSALDHGVPSNVDAIIAGFRHEIETVVPQATRGMCVLGQSSQRWISEGGRVAVVDHNALMSPRFEALQSHYDHVMIPATSIRALVRRMDGELGGSKEYTRNTWLLSRLRTIVFSDSRKTKRGEEGAADRWLHVLPVVHELLAHRHLAAHGSGSGGGEENELKLLRLSATDVAAQLLLADDEGGNDQGSVMQSFTIRGTAVRVSEGGSKHLGPFVSDASEVMPPAEPQFVKSKLWLTSQEKVIATALMLKKLNPDTDVHVVSRSHYLMEEVRRWNAHSKAHHGANPMLLTDVMMSSSDELLSKAPLHKQPHHPLLDASRVHAADDDVARRRDRRRAFASVHGDEAMLS